MKRREFLGVAAAVPAAATLFGGSLINPGLPVVHFQQKKNSSILEIANAEELIDGAPGVELQEASILYPRECLSNARPKIQKVVKVWVPEPIKWTQNATSPAFAFGKVNATYMCSGEMLLVSVRFWIVSKRKNKQDPFTASFLSWFYTDLKRCLVAA
jgi:hypothetical protein